jgi:hypothetical protein
MGYYRLEEYDKLSLADAVGLGSKGELDCLGR